ncbi:hypothetical protein RB195_015569 [Necator americanus]|uniref:Receptor L-domain domain-containing protein n=1 Tax=Necator americanus TaxID=51031 RepID=A0ABR1E5D9_NECAM
MRQFLVLLLFSIWCVLIKGQCDNTAAPDDLKDCQELGGEFVYTEELKEVFEIVHVLRGRLTYKDTNDVTLDAISNLTIIIEESPALEVLSNKNLQDIRALLTMNFDGPPPHAVFVDNPMICDTIQVREKLIEKAGGPFLFNSQCLQQCMGGVVDEDYLAHFPTYCSRIQGDLLIKNRKGVPDSFMKLQQVEEIYGLLIIANNTNIPNLDFLRYLRRIGESTLAEPPLILVNNSGLTSLGLPHLEEIRSGETEYLVVLKYAEGQHISDMNTLQNVAGNRILLSHVESEGEEDEERSGNMWIAIIVVVVGSLFLMVLCGTILVLVKRKDASEKNKQKNQAS